MVPDTPLPTCSCGEAAWDVEGKSWTLDGLRCSFCRAEPSEAAMVALRARYQGCSHRFRHASVFGSLPCGTCEICGLEVVDPFDDYAEPPYVDPLADDGVLGAILVRFAPRLPSAPDAREGDVDQVGVVLEQRDGADVRFMARGDAMALLFAHARTATPPDLASRMKRHALQLDEGATPEIECVVLGWGGCALVYLDRADLARGCVSWTTAGQ